MAAAADDMPPPPTRPDQGQPLSNADFRRMLETPRRSAGEDETPARQQRKAPGGQAGKGPKDVQKKKRREKPQPDKPEEDEGPGYRDRAEERRKGVNPDYERVNEDLASIVTGNVLDQNDNKMLIERSKFLGGDVEHTHLVKGLDYALLQKIRDELVHEDGHEAKEAKPKAKAVLRKPAEEVKFTTALGRSIHEAVFNPVTVPVAELFQPGRTAFVYELEEDGLFAQDIPTTMRRSKADCPPVQESMMGGLDGAVLERIAKIMSYLRPAAGKPGKRLKRREKLSLLGLQPPAANGAALLASGRPALQADGLVQEPVPPADAEEDIFADAGKDYKLEVPKDRAVGAAGGGTTAAPAASYFDKPDDMRDLPALPKEGPDKAGVEGPGGGADMDLDEAPLPPPPPPGPNIGPARPPTSYDPAAAYSAPLPPADPAAYQAFVQASIAAQASADPEYQALLARQAGLSELDGAGPVHPGLPAPAPQSDAGGAVFKRDDSNLAQRREADEREKDPAYVSDAYAECYPGYHNFSHAVVDSDDEDFSHMDSKERGKSRLDFETEEQWQDYKSKKESLPKAAFQFGVKAGDGRKSGRSIGRARDAKLNKDLGKIQSILEKDGGDYSRAFGKGDKGDTGGTLGGEEPAAAFTKKRRV